MLMKKIQAAFNMVGGHLRNQSGLHAKCWPLEDEEPEFASHLPGTALLAIRLILTGN